MQASSCRSTLSRELIKGLLEHPRWTSLAESDALHLQQDLESRGFSLIMNPPGVLVPSPVHVHSTGLGGGSLPEGPFVVVSDSFCSGHRIGYSTVLLSHHGVVATVYGGCLVCDTSSSTSEWLGRMLGIELVRPYTGDVFFIADYTGVTAGTCDSGSTGSDVVDRITVQQA